MNFWEQFAILQASAALHAVVRKYAAKYFSPEELAAAEVVLDALTEIPARIAARLGRPPLGTLDRATQGTVADLDEGKLL